MRKIFPSSPHLTLSRAALLLTLLSGAAPLLPAQTTPAADNNTASSTTINQPFWQCIMPSGSYTVALKEIASVSIQTYVVDGTARVTELNVDTNGSVVARFYYLEAITENTPLTTLQVAQDRVRDTANSANTRVAGGTAPWESVVKNYPTTTHAHTVEYRMPSEELIKKLFEDAENAWMTGKGSKITVASGSGK